MIDLRLGRWQDMLADIPDASVRLFLTSPPYDDARTYEGTNEPVDFGELAAFALRVLMPGGVLAMVLDGAVNDGRQSTTPYRVICEWAALEGWRLLQVLAYGRQGAPGEYRGRFRRDHEPLIIFVRDGAAHVCEKERIAAPSKSDMRRAVGRHCTRTRSGGNAPFGQDSSGNAREIRNVLHRGSVWFYGHIGHGQDPSADTGHPATFAEAFALDAVTVWSNPGDLVVDPFAGAATTGRACIDLGRNFVGAERVGPCPRCGMGFPSRCACRTREIPNGWLNYHAIGMQRLAQRALPIDVCAEGGLS